MSDSPKDRRRRNRPVASTPPKPPVDAADDVADDESADEDSEPREATPARTRTRTSSRFPFSGTAVWPLVTGLAVGFAFGRESHRFGMGDGKSDGAASGASSAVIAADKNKVVYAKMSDFPSGWVKDSDIGTGATLFAGLTDAQKTTVMQALNERNCECGCGMGSLGTCLQKDPNCPRSPQMAKLAVDLVKQGKGVADIEAAIDAKQKDMGGGAKPAAAATPEPPAVPRKVELAAWNPRKGAKVAKVTLVEFSDFQ
jgi:hypothetical protein